MPCNECDVAASVLPSVRNARISSNCRIGQFTGLFMVVCKFTLFNQRISTANWEQLSRQSYPSHDNITSSLINEFKEILSHCGSGRTSRQFGY